LNETFNLTFDDDLWATGGDVRGLAVDGTWTDVDDNGRSLAKEGQVSGDAGLHYHLSVLLGFWLLSYQLLDLIFILIPKHWLRKHAFLQRLITPGSIEQEQRMKVAADYKVRKMISNARALHPDASSNGKRSMSESLTVQAALNFQTQDGETEQVGGIAWTWRRIVNGTLFTEGK
jgi:hypothetical protein